MASQMWSKIGCVARVTLIALIVVEGAPQQKYRVAPNGQLSITESGLEEANDKSTIMRREVGGSGIASGGNHGHVQAAFAELNSTGEGGEIASGGSRDIMSCGWTAFAPSDPCPAECPLLAELSWNPCHFQCVAEESCGKLDPSAVVADYKQGRCRRCMVSGCTVCSSNGKDTCHKCSLGYFLNEKGQCYSGGWFIWSFFSTVGLVILTILVLWFVELMFRRPTNPKGLRNGWRYRKRTRNHMPYDTPAKLGVVDTEDAAGLLYPLSTNLLVTPVGGVGGSLHFSFQVYVILWAGALAAGWAYWAKRYGYDLLKLGILPAHTPQQLCSVVAWGASRQESMFEEKFNFIVLAYMFMTGSCFAFAAAQQGKFIKLDDMVTMKDYALYVRGLPYKDGTEDAEGLYKDFLEKETGQKIVGVSVAWNLMKEEEFEEVEAVLELEAKAQEKAHTLLKYGTEEPPDSDDDNDIVVPEGGLSKAFKPIDTFVGGVFGGEPEPTEEEEVDVDKIRELLEKLKTSDVAFVVFETEEARDAALEVATLKRGFMWDKNVVRLENKSSEPGSCMWHGLSLGSRTRQRNTKLLVGVWVVICCLMIWSFCFYLPYAYYVSAFTYANGNAPSAVANIIFTLLVTAGNQFMYFVADAITRWADFGFEDDREYFYNVYYLVACILNVFADMALTGYLSYKEMIGVGVHTADGKLLESITSFQDIVESYPMQKTLGRMHFCYCFPGTFLVPFIVECVGTVFVPQLLSSKLLSNHKDWGRGRSAEKAMEFFIPFDMGRYSDHILNMSLAVMVLYLPGGFVLPMFMSMALSHVYIYIFDHWRVLRAVPGFQYSRNTVDQFGTLWMGLPCALTASCGVFKGYHIYWPDLNGLSLGCVMLWAFLAHIIMHVVVVKTIYKAKGKHVQATKTYGQSAVHEPNTFFSCNPVHCLRSKYIWGHEPAQVYHIRGKTHLMRANPEIGAHYEDKEAQKPPAPKEAAEATAASSSAAGASAPSAP